MKNIILVLVLATGLVACQKNSYKNFEGTYDVKSSGSVNYFVGDSTFADEPGLVVIKQGEEKDELFLYVETNFVTSIAPLGVSATAKIDGNSYKMEQRNLNISLDLGGTPVSLPFSVTASGVLSDDKNTLTSEIIFSGGITGVMTSVGTKK